MSESRSGSKSHEFFNQNIMERMIDDLFENDLSTNLSNYSRLYDCIKQWLLTPDLFTMNEKSIQLNFYLNCMKVYSQQIHETLYYSDDHKAEIFQNLFQGLMPDFCLVNFYNCDLKSSSSGLDLQFLPIHIISILEIKKNMKDKDIGQLLHYLQIVLDYSPKSRTFIIGAITDFRYIRYGKVLRSNDDRNFIYEASIKPITNQSEFLLNYLAKFFTIDSSQLGFDTLVQLPKNIRMHNTLLGVGANSIVMNCFMDKNETNQYALKITNKPVDREIFIYRKLYNNKYNIQKIHKYALIFLHPPGKMISSVNLLNNLITIWDQLKHAHRNNIVHCDIRRSNIIEIFRNHQTKNSDILIIDWQSASEIGFNQEYCGTLSTASKYILDHLTYKRNKDIPCLPIDDCISFMKVILLEILPKEIKQEVLAKVKQGSYSGINLIYEQIYKTYTNEQSIILKVIQFLEKNRSILNNEILISYMDQCLKKDYCLRQLKNEQTDIDYFLQLEGNLILS